MKNKIKRSFTKGFTLTELVIAVVMIAILSGVTVGVVAGVKDKNKKIQFVDIRNFFSNVFADQELKFDTIVDYGDINSKYTYPIINEPITKWGVTYAVSKTTRGLEITANLMFGRTPDGKPAYQSQEPNVYDIPVDVLTGVVINYITKYAGFKNNLYFLDTKQQGNYFCMNYSMNETTDKIQNIIPNYREGDEVNKPKRVYTISKSYKHYKARGLFVSNFEQSKNNENKSGNFVEKENAVIENNIFVKKCKYIIKNLFYFNDYNEVSIINLTK
ncbi:MAG: prepilin-type N-terminal cleavage/methylation domain-containing protein [Bacilli bacterium]